MKTDSSSDQDLLEIDLRKPGLAALYAWLWPGAGHLYQRRYAKGVLFMVCILGTFLYGLHLGGGRVVYASWKKEDRRWQYVCQLGIGAPAMPALLQSYLVRSGKEPLFAAAYYEDTLEKVREPREAGRPIVKQAFMAPPPGPLLLNEEDVLARWHKKYHSYFEMGTLYTMVAGLLNVLAIYDAFAGPVLHVSEEEDDSEKASEDDSAGMQKD